MLSHIRVVGPSRSPCLKMGDGMSYVMTIMVVSCTMYALFKLLSWIFGVMTPAGIVLLFLLEGGFIGMGVAWRDFVIVKAWNSRKRPKMRVVRRKLYVRPSLEKPGKIEMRLHDTHDWSKPRVIVWGDTEIVENVSSLVGNLITFSE